MSNRNPSPATRFGPNNPGRAKQKGARDRLSATFLTAFADDFEKHGSDVIATVRANDPAAYLRVAASIIPKEFEVKHALDDVTDDELEQAIGLLSAMLAKQKPKQETVN
jgi:hypothetical protein